MKIFSIILLFLVSLSAIANEGGESQSAKIDILPLQAVKNNIKPGIWETFINSTNKQIVSCKYSPVLEILGNDECKLFCRDSHSECTYDNDEKKKQRIICPAIKTSESSWACPNAYDCLVDADTTENLKNKIYFNINCEGVVLKNRL